MELPKAIEHCPIFESVFEIRFSSSIYASAVFGLIYNKIKDKYPTVEKLPIMQIPEEVRENDPNLKYKPIYKVIGENYIIQIGPKVFSVNSAGNSYPGWEKLSKEINSCVEKLYSLDIIDEIERIGLRYINFFELDIFRKINFKVEINSSPSSLVNSLFRTEIRINELKQTLQIANNARQENVLNKKDGSIIDIDTFTNPDDFMDLDDLFNLLEKAHLEEKRLFFSLLHDDFLQSLKPIY